MAITEEGGQSLSPEPTISEPTRFWGHPEHVGPQEPCSGKFQYRPKGVLPQRCSAHF